MGKLSKTLITTAIILLSLGVAVIQSNPSSLENIVPGLILVIVGIAVAVIWEEKFKSEIFSELKE